MHSSDKFASFLLVFIEDWLMVGSSECGMPEVVNCAADVPRTGTLLSAIDFGKIFSCKCSLSTLTVFLSLAQGLNTGSPVGLIMQVPNVSRAFNASLVS